MNNSQNQDSAKSAAQRNIKTALVDLDGKSVPEWVIKRLADESIPLVIHHCTTPEELMRYAGDAGMVWLLGGSRILTTVPLENLSHCWAILRTGSGTDNVPVAEATRRGIVVANTPEATSDPVSDHVIALLFDVIRQVSKLDRSVRAGQWDYQLAHPLPGPSGQKLGLVGFGHVSRHLVRKLKGFAMTTFAYDPYVSEEKMSAAGVQKVSLDELLSEADIVSLHCPLTEQTHHLIGDREFGLMKPSAILINTSRGPVVDETALIRALRERRIAGAGLDVLETEPPSVDHPLLQFDTVVLTPHTAGGSYHGMEVRWKLSVETVIALAQGRWPRSCVNREVHPRFEFL
ncbi:MAG: C-terminal binding protein [Terriglobia bacterium]